MTLKNYAPALAIIAGLFLVTVSCEENVTLHQRINSPSSPLTRGIAGRITNYTFTGLEGDPISRDVAVSWVANYRSQDANDIAHFFGRQTFNNILAKNGCVGIRIYYAIDDLNAAKLLLVGADVNGNNLVPTYGVMGKKSGIDIAETPVSAITLVGNEGDSVSADVSSRWIASYNAANPQRIQAHFFGYQIIKQILAETGCIGIRIYYALNDAGVPQLLLVGVTGAGQNIMPLPATGSRVADGGGTIGDVSFPCPSYCSGT